MIRSMTGYGAAERLDDQVRIAVEIRTVNNRFFKASIHAPDGLGAAEVSIEKTLRETISRGTVSLSLVIEPRGGAARAPINKELLTAYWNDLNELSRQLGGTVERLLDLPGIVGDERVLLTGIDNVQPRIDAVVKEAVERLNAMRDTEGNATAADMKLALDDMERRIAAIQTRVPAVIEEYRNRLRERVQALLEDTEIKLDDQTLAREVAFAAERSDVNEELARLASHVAQYRELLSDSGPAGRKLEFLTQEMYREVNTLGSKSNDSEISRQVVELKVGVDRLREQSQNVE
jgi:uncharacterized protein (TIGR00255 family)